MASFTVLVFLLAQHQNGLSRSSFGAGLSVAKAQQMAPQKQARQILDATGVQGGLVVHIGCGDGKLTAALRANDSYLVHGLDFDAANVKKAREHIQSLGLYGLVSVDQFKGKRLPYTDNLVNLIVADRPIDVPMNEVMRVLVPRGVAYIRHKGEWIRVVKPWPEMIDEWTHWLHDASGNAVARDRVVGPPRCLQWTAEPLWSRHHDTVPSTSAMVSSRGRLFYISDEAPDTLQVRSFDTRRVLAQLRNSCHPATPGDRLSDNARNSDGMSSHQREEFPLPEPLTILLIKQ